MSRAAAILGAAIVAALVPAPAEGARVKLMVVGKERVLRDAGKVRLAPRRVSVGGRRCAVPARTPLGALAATPLRLRLRDYGACGRRGRDAASLYVRAVGRERERGRGGWVYKVGRRAGTAGAGDVAGARLHGGQRLTWFWCELNGSGGCQRTLVVRSERRTAAPGEPLRVTVRGYDDFGRGVPVAGATVRLGSASGLTGADGGAVLSAPAEPGAATLRAERAGMVTSFPERVRVG